MKTSDMMQEYHLISTALGGGGWSAERPVLPQSAEDQAFLFMRDVINPEKETAFRWHLRQIFASSVEAETCRQEYRARSVSSKRPQGAKEKTGRKSQPKFGTAIGQSFVRFRDEYGKGGDGRDASLIHNNRVPAQPSQAHLRTRCEHLRVSILLKHCEGSNTNVHDICYATT